MRFKQGIKLTNLQPQTLLAMYTVDIVFDEEGLPEPTCTSVNDSSHMANSRHYQGLAFDLRSKDLSTIQKLKVYNNLRNRLRHLGFDIIQESLGLEQEHIHLEFDPKGI